MSLPNTHALNNYDINYVGAAGSGNGSNGGNGGNGGGGNGTGNATIVTPTVPPAPPQPPAPPDIGYERPAEPEAPASIIIVLLFTIAVAAFCYRKVEGAKEK